MFVFQITVGGARVALILIENVDECSGTNKTVREYSSKVYVIKAVSH